MLTRITGRLDDVQGNAASVQLDGAGLVYEILVPTFLVERLLSRVGEVVTFHTLEYLESQNQGTSFIPRLIGFATTDERRFFETFTTVKGIGNRKALRALAREPALIARAIAARDSGALQELPEIGKRLAETIVAELHGKVDPFLTPGEAGQLELKSAASGLPPHADNAVAALVALGEARPDAERMVRRALTRKPAPETTDAIVAAAYETRQ